MIEFTFTNGHYLLFLLILPFLFLIHFVALKTQRHRALRFANFDAIARIRGIDFFSKNIVILVMTLVILFLLVLSLSGLNIIRESEASPHSFVIAIDSSRSMEADDFSPSRMEVAKEVAIEFIESAPTDTEIGIVSFSGSALIEQELTTSRSLLRDSLESLEISRVGGTDIYDAVVTGSNLLSGEKSGVLLLISDGQINVGGVEESINYAKIKGITIHSVAMGTEGGGLTTYGLSQIDKKSLEAIAYNTGGNYFDASDRNSLLASLNDAFENSRMKVEIEAREYLLIIVIILFVLEYILINTRYKILP
ncbi:hypothetical protein COU60_04965 [Candidatus Pacearchaeota archaeon CG10_big_fil_rev_8_21_14_0_10_34_76]|nr:MAG: hypothetical protein COU60_04965 [Candidatus Pacearchaeota archaeon CG10_big_fil_rev_8_21_14_0_10_34_76]